MSVKLNTLLCNQIEKVRVAQSEFGEISKEIIQFQPEPEARGIRLERGLNSSIFVC
uniref:Uncharacterized protein MANES_S106600 n=1 Tax=Rhizophora mucronata TaxID=61149 RepID=A0A2P2IP02_RHIMU